MLTSEFISVTKLKLHDSEDIMINKRLCFIHAGFPVRPSARLPLQFVAVCFPYLAPCRSLPLSSHSRSSPCAERLLVVLVDADLVFVVVVVISTTFYCRCSPSEVSREVRKKTGDREREKRKIMKKES